MDRQEIADIVREEIENYFEVRPRFCPTCNHYTTMVSAYGGGRTDNCIWLCFGCLKHYKEELVPVKELPPQYPPSTESDGDE